MSEKEPIKITIEDLEAEEKPLVAERPAEQRGRKAVGEVASAAGQAAGQGKKRLLPPEIWRGRRGRVTHAAKQRIRLPAAQAL